MQTVAVVSALTLVAVAQWAPGLRAGYWIDEVLSLGLADLPLHEIPGALRMDGAPPLWYLVLGVWTRLVGTGEAATHLLSLLAAAACVPLAWWGANRLAGRRAGLFAAAVASLSPFLNHFSRETRMYTLVVALGIVVATTFVRAFVDGSQRDTVAFAVALTALLYTHNWGLYTVVGAGVALVPAAAYAADRRALLRRAGLAFGAAAMLYLPWVPTLLGQLGDTGAPWSHTPDVRDLVRELAALLRDERVLLAVGLGAGAGLAPLLRPPLRRRDGAAATSLALLVAVPVTLGWLTAHIEPSWATRYLAVIVGPLVLLAGIGLSRAGGLGVASLAITAVLILQPITRLQGGIPRPADAKSNANLLGVALGPQLDGDDVVVVAQPEVVPLVRWYVGDGPLYADPTGPVPDPTVMDWRDAQDRLEAADVEQDFLPLLDRLRPGSRLLLVLPAGRSRQTDTEWIDLFRKLGNRWERTVRRDDRFELIDRQRPEDPTEIPLKGLLFERVAAR